MYDIRRNKFTFAISSADEFLVFLLHCIAFHFISFLVLFCCTVHYCLFSFLIFSLLATSSINRIWPWCVRSETDGQPSLTDQNEVDENEQRWAEEIRNKWASNAPPHRRNVLIAFTHLYTWPWPLTSVILKTFSARPTRTANICRKFHWILSAHWSNVASREICVNGQLGDRITQCLRYLFFEGKAQNSLRV